MTVSIWRFKDHFENNVRYSTSIHDHKMGELIEPVEIDIPDRFMPDTDDGGWYLKLNGPDGKYSLLENVLCANSNGDPAIKWTDPKLNCTRMVALKVV